MMPPVFKSLGAQSRSYCSGCKAVPEFFSCASLAYATNAARSYHTQIVFFAGSPGSAHLQLGFSLERRNLMPTSTPQEITTLLLAWGSGDRAALDQLMPLVYDELRRMAHRYLGHERAGHTMQSAALVNEAYLKMLGGQHMDFQNRAHFFAVAAQLMRMILVDYARTRNRGRRGGGAQRVSLEDALAVASEQSADLVALDDALNTLATFDERKSKVAELRFFGGLSVEETAEVLQVAPITVMREWRLAKAWLYRELSREAEEESG
jgi:RNA polymerase sigma-70 factor (ECF subfamily)